MMSIAEFWDRMTHGWRPRSPGAQGGDVNDELMFHFRGLVNDRLAEGLPFEAAWERAEQQFGSVRRYDNECRSLDAAQRLKWLPLALLASLAVVAWVWWSAVELPGRRLGSELHLLRQEVQALREVQLVRSERTSAATAPPQAPVPVDLAGAVEGADGSPLTEATILVILKTWPGGRYRQEAFTATTDADGRFQLPRLLPMDGQYAVLVAALKDGFAFKSTYQLKQGQPVSQPDPIVLKLEPASHVTVVLRDAHGQPIADALVAPSERKSRQGEDHLIYFQGSEPARRTTDAQGRVRLDCFLAGDQAEIYVQLPGDNWNSRRFQVSGDDSVVELASSES